MKYLLLLILFIVFPFVFDCTLVYALSIATTRSALLMSMLKAALFVIPFVCYQKHIKLISYAYIALVYIPGLLNVILIRQMLTLCCRDSLQRCLTSMGLSIILSRIFWRQMTLITVNVRPYLLDLSVCARCSLFIMSNVS